MALVGSATAQTNKTGSVKLEGQIVCSVCWFEADRTKTPFGTAADLECEIDCAAKNIPAALAVKNAAGDGVTLYILEDGKFRKKEKNWLAYMASHAEVTGTVSTKKDKQYIKVDALNVLSSPKTEAPAPQDEIGATEAELVLKDLFGVEQKLSSYRGRIVVLNFWATWCVPCRKEMPDLAAIQNQYAALGVQVIGASADAIDARSKVMEFIKETKINFPIWLGATTADMQRFGLGQALPGTVIIGRDGKIISRIRGIVKEADLRKQIDALISQAAAKADKEEVATAQTKSKPSEVSTVPS